MTEVVWAPEAREDLKKIYLAIARFNPAAAVAIVRDVKAKTALLARHPRIGVERPDILPKLRMTVVPPYLIFYDIGSDAPERFERITIIRILDGRRDLTELL